MDDLHPDDDRYWEQNMRDILWGNSRELSKVLYYVGNAQ